MPTLEARNLGRDLIDEEIQVTLVTEIDVRFGEGEFASITGPSGSGKSSLLYLLGLLDVPTRGDVLVDGVSTSKLTEEDRARVRLENFGFVFQFHFLLPELSVLNNIMLPMRELGRLSMPRMKERAMELLEQLGMTDQAKKYPGQLSGGQRQRVSIARALANKPRFIFADEPTGALDSKNSLAVFDILHTLAGQGHTVIVVTHDEHLAAKTARRVHMSDGRLFLE